MDKNGDLDTHLKNLSENCAEFMDEMLDDVTHVMQVWVPVFKNGQLASTRKENSTDYRKIRHAVMRDKRWTDDAAFIASKKILIREENALRGNGQHHDEPAHFATKQIALFVAQLAKNKKERSATAFNYTLSKFYDHMNANLSHTTYIAPLYSVKGDFTIRLAANLHVREVTEDEYSRIVRLQNTQIRELDQYQRRLKFVLSCKLPGPTNRTRLQKVTSIYSFAISLLNLFKDGYPQFGRVYEIESEHMEVGRIELMKSHYENPAAFKEMRMTKGDASQFATFYQTVIQKPKKVKKVEFLNSAVARFGMAYAHQNVANRIVDYVISLETLLTTSPGESRLKLAHRTAALYADTDSGRVCTWEFIKQAYGFRSGMVHESKGRPVIMFGTPITSDKVVSILHKIAKESIHRMVGLLGQYEKQKDILNALDRSIYDRKEMGAIRKMWRPIRPYHKSHEGDQVFETVCRPTTALGPRDSTTHRA